MMGRFVYFFITLFLTTGSYFVRAQQLKTFDNIPGRNPSDYFQCRVREVGSDQWHNAFVMQTKSKNPIPDEKDENGNTTVSGNGYTKQLKGWTASWIAFEFSGTSVEVEISLKSGISIRGDNEITVAMVRPAADASAAVIKDGKAYVTINKYANINVDINGQMEDQYTGMDYTDNGGAPIHTISIFANPFYHVPDTTNSKVHALSPGETIPADRSQWDTIYFQPGVHDIGTPFTMRSNDVFYIPGDAVVHGTIHPVDAWGINASKNVTVYGSGTLSCEEVPRDKGKKYNKAFTYQGEAWRLEGFVVADPANHTFNMNSSNPNGNPNIYENLKILGWRVNGDAINAFRNSQIRNCFFRTQDDVFYYGGNDVIIEDCVTWNDFNGAVLYLTKGAQTFDESCFKNIDVIYHRAGWHYWDGGRVISFRDRNPGNVIKNVQIKNVLVEDPYPAFPPFYGYINDNGDNSPLEYENIVIENVIQKYPGVSSTKDSQYGKPRNTLLGLDESRKFSNITFKNCYYNGKWLHSFEDGDFLQQYTSNITFLVDGDASLKCSVRNGDIEASTPLSKQDSSYAIEGMFFKGAQLDTIFDVENSGLAPGEGLNGSQALKSTIQNATEEDEGLTLILDDVEMCDSNGEYTFTFYAKSLNTPEGRPFRLSVEAFDEDGNDVTSETHSTTDDGGTVSWEGLESDYLAQSITSVITANTIGGKDPKYLRLKIHHGKYDNTYWFDEFTLQSKPLQSSDATLSELVVSAGILVPEFAPTITDYTVELPKGTVEIPIVSSTATNPGATAEINEATELPGAATVKVTAADQISTKTYTINFSVLTEQIDVTSVSIDNCPEEKITIENNHQFTATVYPSDASFKSVNWSSSDTTVASVDAKSGLLTAKAPGTATITVTTFQGGLKDSCEIEVAAEAIAVYGITISDCPSSILQAGSTHQLVANVAPANATDKTVTWSSSNSEVASVDENGLVSALSQGSVKITATTNDGGYSSNCSIGVFGTATGIENVVDNKGIKVYPNPIKNQLRIENLEGEHCTIYNILGQKVFDSHQKRNEKTNFIDTSSWQKGVYIIKVASKNAILIIRQ